MAGINMGASGTTIEGVSTEYVDRYWPHVASWVASAIKDAGHVWTIEDVRGRLASGHMQLWVIWSGQRMIGCLTTETYGSSRGYTCGIPVVYCDDMGAALLDSLRVIEAWATSVGCVRLQGEGRRGWERALKPHGWRTITTQVEKVL